MSHELVQHPLYGHCAVAAKDIAAGEIVLDEEPLLFIDYTQDLLAHLVPGDLSYKRKRAFVTLSRPAKVSLCFVQADKEVRERVIQQLYTPSVDSKVVKRTLAYKAARSGLKELRNRGVLFSELADFSDLDLIRFSLLASANAHDFDEHAIALLAAGAKVSHTCLAPNVAVTTRFPRGQEDRGDRSMRHIAVRDIRKGELLLGTYAKLSYQTTKQRQAYLLDNKMFLCRCTDCTKLDLLRGIKCFACLDDTADENHQLLSTQYRTTTPDTKWVCKMCKSTKSDSDALSSGSNGDVEQSITQQLHQIEVGDLQFDLAQCQALHNQSCQTFGWRHTLTAATALLTLDQCSTLIDSADSDAVPPLLSLITHLSDRLEHWFKHLSDSRLNISDPTHTPTPTQNGLDTDDALVAAYLLLSDRLMSCATLHHTHIPSTMALTQHFLLYARPVIELRRTWSVPHAMQEYFDELVQTLHQLVNGEYSSTDTLKETDHERVDYSTTDYDAQTTTEWTTTTKQVMME